MRNYYTTVVLLALLLLGVNSAIAQTHIITAEGTTIPTDIFTPHTTNAVVGDTITWIWIDGTHTTESVTIPVGAASWASNLNGNTTTFSYVVTVPGTYYYDCHAAFSHGMDGYIQVTAAVGIDPNETKMNSSIFPNPFGDQVTLQNPHADQISVFNMKGQQIFSGKVNPHQSQVELNTSELPSGVYFFSLEKDGYPIETRKLLKQ